MIRLISMAFVFHSVFAFGKHPVHFTIVNMDLDLAKNELTYSIRLFQEDMNTLFMDLYHEELFHSSDTFDFEKIRISLFAISKSRCRFILMVQGSNPN